jgi:hypothetical protein
MDIVSDQVYLPSYRRKRSKRASLALLGLFWAILYYVEKQTGILGFLWKYIARYAVFFASEVGTLCPVRRRVRGTAVPIPTVTISSLDDCP